MRKYEKRTSTVQMLEAPNKVKCWTILNRVAKISQFSNAICIKHEPFHLYFGEISKQVKNSRERDIKHTKSMQTKYIKNHLLRKKWIFINNKDEELYLPDAVVSQKSQHGYYRLFLGKTSLRIWSATSLVSMHPCNKSKLST